MGWLAVLVVVVVAGVVVVPRLLKGLIRKRLQGYLVDAATPDPSLPERLAEPRTVAVIGAGVAGLTAAVTLARRGFSVTVLEAASYLGGKLGSWPVELAPGRQVWVSHGFHAFFPHYFNFLRFLDSVGARRGFRSIGDYVIVGKDHTVRFKDLDTTPVFNLLSLARAGVFSIGDAVKPPGRDLYGVFLEYEHDATLHRFDHLTFKRFDELGKVPPRLKLAFNTFARAFFADEDKLSFAELIKSFHFYYLSQDGGLIYDFPTRDYEPAILAPVRAELERHRATVALSTPVRSLARQPDGHFVVNGQPFDKVVLATDVVGTRAIATTATGLPEELTGRLGRLQPGQRYAVLRLWIDRDVRKDIPVFVIVDRDRVLDALTVYHRFEVETQADVAAHGGYVVELHCYAVPEAMSDQEVRDSLVAEVQVVFPELAGMHIHHEVFQIRRDFTAFHVGMYRDRPTVETGVTGLYCAGDWVKLPFPAMLLEAACSAGLWAANGILREEGLREELVRSVPLRGLMAGIPQPPARKLLEPPGG